MTFLISEAFLGPNFSTFCRFFSEAFIIFLTVLNSFNKDFASDGPMPGNVSMINSCFSFNVNGFLCFNKEIGFLDFSSLFEIVWIKAAVSL